MEWIKGMFLRDYAIGLLLETSKHRRRNRLTMSDAMKEARMARQFYLLVQKLENKEGE
jgi:hypothetical protein